jgi:DNA-binding NtrC family response regulator
MRRYSAESKKRFTAMTGEATQRLLGYRWPGNVRELANTIERAVVLGIGPAISIEDLPARVTGASTPPAEHPRSYREAMEMTRRQLVTRALEQSKGNRAAAAKALGLHEKYFLRLIKTLGIK